MQTLDISVYLQTTSVGWWCCYGGLKGIEAANRYGNFHDNTALHERTCGESVAGLDRILADSGWIV